MKTPKQTQTQQKQEKDDVQYVLKSNGFRIIREHLKEQHPLKKGLGIAATMEQRAFHQIRCENYEQVMIWLDAMAIDSILRELPSDYSTEGKK